MLGVLAEPRIHPSHCSSGVSLLSEELPKELGTGDGGPGKKVRSRFFFDLFSLAITRSCAIRVSNRDSGVLNLDEKH